MISLLSESMWMLIIVGAIFLIIALFTIKELIYYSTYFVIFLLPLEEIALLFTGFTLIRFIVLLTFGIWTLQIFLKQRKPKFSNLSIFLVLIIIYGGLSVLWSQDSSAALRSLFTLFQLILWVIMVVDLLDTEDRIQTAGRIFILSSIITSLLAVILFQLGTLDEANRVAAFEGQNPNGFSRSLGFAFLMLIYSISTNYFSRSKLIKIIGTIIIGASITLAVSRGTYIALVAPLFLLFISSKVKRKFSSFIIIALSFTLIYYVFNDFVTETIVPRLISYENLGGRRRIWITALEMFKDNFIAGVGLGNFPVVFSKYSLIVSGWVANSGSHNVYIRIATELGLLGILLFLLFHFKLFLEIFTTPIDSSVKIFLLAIFLYLIVGGMSTDLLLDKTYWFVFGLIIAMVENGKKAQMLEPTK